MDNDRREKMEAAYERLGGPSARQLRYALLRDGVSITEKEAQEFTNSQQDSQIFRQKPHSDGRTAVRDKHDVMQVDLISLNQIRSFGNKFVLAVMDPFTRKMWLEPLQTKRPPEVTAAFKMVLDRAFKPTEVLSDAGNEFKNEFDELLKSEGIIHKFKRSINSLGRLDRGIMAIKKQLFKRLSKRGSLKWTSLIKPVEDAYNNRMIIELGVTPKEVDSDSKQAKVYQFKEMQKNAENFAHNMEVSETKMEKLKKEGAFREMLEKTAFERSFRPTFGEKKIVAKVERGQVIDADGKRYAVQEVLAVPQEGEDKPIPNFKGRELIDARLRNKLQSFAKELFDALPDEEITTQAAARLMREDYKTTKPKTMTFATFLRLFPRLFTVNGNKVKRNAVPVGVRMGERS